jgi:MoxR-like ATPase
MKVRIGYPDRSSELSLLASRIGRDALSTDVPSAVVERSALVDLQDQVSRVAVADSLQEYLVDLGRATREHRAVRLGLSPRGLLTWQRVAQARASLQGREFVTPDDIQDVAVPVLSVRLVGDFESVERMVAEILAAVAVPVTAAKR